jgi:hypothetical protein
LYLTAQARKTLYEQLVGVDWRNLRTGRGALIAMVSATLHPQLQGSGRCNRTFPANAGSAGKLVAMASAVTHV